MSRQIAEGMAPMFQFSAEEILASPLVLIGTPDECIKELKRRVKDWGVTQFLFGAERGGRKAGAAAERRVIAHV